jgi:tetratricopeptide (TPR) repeat protein
LYLRKRNFKPVKNWQRYGILAVALLAFGAVRLPFEARLAKELRTAGLTPAPMEIGTRDRIGQTSTAVALGGLRTLVATFMNLRAFSYFQVQRWDDLMETFDTIVDLAPRTRYYWETGAWHSAYNAASYYLNDSKLPALRRREAWRASILRGRAFLERGIRNNPDDWSLAANLGFLLSDSNKFTAFRDPDETFAAAAEAYRRSAATGTALPYVRRAELYSLARVAGKEKEALALARSLFAQQQNRTPTLLILLLVLEAHEHPEMDAAARAIELFGSPEKAYEALASHWHRIRERFPVYGVAGALEALEQNLKIPQDKSIFSQPMPVPFDPEDLFSK